MSDNLKKLEVHYRSQAESLNSRVAVINKANEEFQNGVEETQLLYTESLQDPKNLQRQQAIEWNKHILDKAKADKAHEEAAQSIPAEDAKQKERKIGLDAHEELAAREMALAAKLLDRDVEAQAILA